MNQQHVQFGGVPAAASGTAVLRPGRGRHTWFAGHPTTRTRPRLPETLHPLLAWVLQQAGLDPGQYRASALNRRLSAALRAVRTTCPDRARQLLEARPELLQEVVGAVLLGVSDFFRDPRVFAVIAQHILPELLQQRPMIRVWSAACSDGRELYSLALLLAERKSLERSWLLGTDCRAAAIAQARSGRYPAAVLASVPQPLRAYFRPDDAGDDWRRLAPVIREAVHWQMADLLQARAAGTWDLILWRNMAIYLSQHRAAGLWCRLTEALSAGGYLVTGKAERPPCGLPLERLAPCVYRRTERPIAEGERC